MFIKKIPFKIATRVTLSIFVLTMVNHILIITSVIPFDAVWGGKLTSIEEMYQFESVSIGITLLMILTVLMKAKILPFSLPAKLVSFLLWLWTVLFALNTLGNLFAETLFEKLVFTPVTLILVFLFSRLAIEKEVKE